MSVELVLSLVAVSLSAVAVVFSMRRAKPKVTVVLPAELLAMMEGSDAPLN
jgi:hypothetical protein